MRYALYDYYNAPCERSATMAEIEALRADMLAAPETDEMPEVGAPCSYDLGGGRLIPIC